MRRDVVWNGRAYVGVCRYCDTPIERVGRRRWRRRADAGADEGKGEPKTG